MTSEFGAFALRRRRKLPMIRQCEAAECGLACLAMIASHHGRKTNLAALRLQHAVSARGATLNHLMTTAARLDLGTRALRLGLDSLDRLASPCVLHWQMNHFVVLAGIARGRYTVHDPAAGIRSLTRSEMSAGFTGIALELRPTVSFTPRDERRRLRLRDFWSRATGLSAALAQTLLLSVVIQCLLLAAPFYLQLVVDEALARFDADFLIVLAVAFVLLVLLRELATALRAWLILFLGSSLDYGLAAGLATRIFRLPMTWFEKRHVGDVISRFSSTRAVRNLFAEGLVASVIDGIMALGALVIMLFYSATLTALVVAALAISLTVRLLLYRPLRTRTEEEIVAKAAEQSILIESIRAMQSIKVFGREPQRLSYWQNRFAEAINASVRLGRLGIGIGFSNGLLFGVENVIVVCLAALAVLEGSFTVGMLFAFMAYKRHLLDAAVALVERIIEIRLLGVHLDRMADIALASPEPDGGGSAPARTATTRRWQPVLSLSKCRFSYWSEDEPLFDELSLDVGEGEFLVIVGPSGSGKSTLLKMLLGLQRPDRGSVLYRGVPITRIANTEYRRRFGTVMQDDRLLSGTLAENIAFFDPEPQLDRVFACARQASIHDEIAAMPMGFNSLVGDMGSVLSAGQRQRVLLARALYAEPEVLILDEGTANLDPVSERAVLDTLRGLECTRICVAHGDRILRCADRAVVLWDKSLRPLGEHAVLRATETAAGAARIR